MLTSPEPIIIITTSDTATGYESGQLYSWRKIITAFWLHEVKSSRLRQDNNSAKSEQNPWAIATTSKIKALY
jgi:hypothetical protein